MVGGGFAIAKVLGRNRSKRGNAPIMARNVKKPKGTHVWIGAKCHKKGIAWQDPRATSSLEFTLRSQTSAAGEPKGDPQSHPLAKGGER